MDAYGVPTLVLVGPIEQPCYLEALVLWFIRHVKAAIGSSKTMIRRIAG
jgi:hypothetical protein